MSVANGQNVDALVTNAAFLSRLVDTSTIGKVALNNTDVLSGTSLPNVQQAINETFDAVGVAGTGDATRKNYSSNKVVSNGDSHKTAIGKLDARFHETSGHVHDGTAGNGPKLDASNLVNVNNFHSAWQSISAVGAVGPAVVISAQMAGKVSGGAAASLGVVTSAPYNKVQVFNSSTGDGLEDPQGQRVYGRITELFSVWTVSFYTNEAGVETSYTLPSSNITVYFLEVFNQNTRPTIPETPEFGSFDITADVIDASSTHRGLVNTLTQSFAGNKTFDDALISTASFTANGKVQYEIYTDAAATGANASVSLVDSTIIRFTNVSLTSIASISGPTSGRFIFLLNNTGASVTLKHNIGSPATNGLLTGGTDAILTDTASALLVYDDISSRWRVMSGGGGGIGFQEVPTGVVNGVNAIFGPLTYLPSNSNSVLFFIDSLAIPKSAYSVAGQTITITDSNFIPATGQTVYAFYLTAGVAATPAAPTGTVNVEYRTLSAGESSAKQLTLLAAPNDALKVMVDLIGGGAQEYAIDFSVAGAILNWNGLGLDGIITTGDKLRVFYLT